MFPFVSEELALNSQQNGTADLSYQRLWLLWFQCQSMWHPLHGSGVQSSLLCRWESTSFHSSTTHAAEQGPVPQKNGDRTLSLAQRWQQFKPSPYSQQLKSTQVMEMTPCRIVWNERMSLHWYEGSSKQRQGTPHRDLQRSS